MPGPAVERLPAVKSRFARQRAGCGGLQRLISMTSLPATSFRALLSGLAKRLFYGEAALTNESLVERLWGSSGEGGVDTVAALAEVQTWEEFLSGAAANSWDVGKVEEVLLKTSVSADHVKVFATFWNAEREKIHTALVRTSNWNGRLKKVSWRADMKTMGKTGADLNEPLALLELRTVSGHNITEEENVKRQTQFEMNREEIGQLLTVLSVIEASMSTS